MQNSLMLYTAGYIDILHAGRLKLKFTPVHANNAAFGFLGSFQGT
jgi:hypothetical protein